MSEPSLRSSKPTITPPERPEPKPITCQRCGHVYDKGACPECWYADAKWGR